MATPIGSSSVATAPAALSPQEQKRLMAALEAQERRLMRANDTRAIITRSISCCPIVIEGVWSHSLMYLSINDLGRMACVSTEMAAHYIQDPTLWQGCITRTGAKSTDYPPCAEEGNALERYKKQCQGLLAASAPIERYASCLPMSLPTLCSDRPAKYIVFRRFIERQPTICIPLLAKFASVGCLEAVEEIIRFRKQLEGEQQMVLAALGVDEIDEREVRIQFNLMSRAGYVEKLSKAIMTAAINNRVEVMLCLMKEVNRLFAAGEARRAFLQHKLYPALLEAAYVRNMEVITLAMIPSLWHTEWEWNRATEREYALRELMEKAIESKRWEAVKGLCDVVSDTNLEYALYNLCKMIIEPPEELQRLAIFTHLFTRRATQVHEYLYLDILLSNALQRSQENRLIIEFLLNEAIDPRAMIDLIEHRYIVSFDLNLLV